MMDAIHSLADTLLFRSAPACKECRDEGRGTVRMEDSLVYVPAQALYVEAWECPECGHAVYRGDPPRFKTPTGEWLD